MVTEQQFYEFFKIEPLYISNCQYYNEFNYGLDIGEDVCDYILEEDPQMVCEECEKVTNRRKWYPAITWDVLAMILWICPVTHNQSFNIDITDTDFIDKVLQHIINYFKDDKFVTPKYKLIQTLLKAHLQEMSRW